MVLLALFSRMTNNLWVCYRLTHHFYFESNTVGERVCMVLDQSFFPSVFECSHPLADTNFSSDICLCISFWRQFENSLEECVCAVHCVFQTNGICVPGYQFVNFQCLSHSNFDRVRSGFFIFKNLSTFRNDFQ